MIPVEYKSEDYCIISILDNNPRKSIKYFQTIDYSKTSRGGGRLENLKTVGFLRNTGLGPPSPLENSKAICQASIQCLAIIDPPEKRHLNGV